MVPPIGLGLLATAVALLGTWLARHFGATLSLPWEIGLAACVGIAAAMFAPGVVPIAFSAWTTVLIVGFVALGVVDALRHEVPDALSLPIIGLGLLHAATLPGTWWPFAAGAGALILLGGLGALAKGSVLSKSIGGGDVLLAAGALAWLGPLVLVDLVILTAVFIMPQAALRLTARSAGAETQTTVQNGIALAPALGAAVLVIWLSGPIL